MLYKKCQIHPNMSHPAWKCYGLQKAFKDGTQIPDIHDEPEDQKGKNKEDDRDPNNFQNPSRVVNVLFGGSEANISKRKNKLISREIMAIEPATPRYLKCSEIPISFSRVDQWISFSNPGRYPLVLDPTVAGAKLSKVLIDGGSDLNVIFADTL